MRLPGVLATLTVAILVAAVQSGCGASNAVDPAAVASAAGATARAGGADISSTGTMRISGLPRPLGFTATGQTDSTGHKARMQMNMSDFASVVPQAGNPDDWKIDMVFDYPVIYMRFPLLAKQVGKPWVKEDIAKFARSAGINVPGLSQGSQNPRQYVDFLRSANGVKRVGTDTVRGVKTTHYKGTVDLPHYPDRLPAAQRAQGRAAIQRLIQLTGSSSYPMEAWVDSKKLVRRMKISYSMKLPNTSQRMAFTETTDLYGFGLKPVIKPPLADQVKDITDLATKQAKQSSLGR